MKERTYGSMTTDEFLDKMISFFPQIKDAVEENFDTYGEILYTNIIEDEVMPLILELIARDDQNRLKEIFKYFELVSENACQDLFNCFSSTALEILGNDRKVLNKAKEYMGPLTAKYQRDADLDLGRNV